MSVSEIKEKETINMGYYCSCSDVKFFMKAENIEEALRLLAPTQYGPNNTPEEVVLEICNGDSFIRKQTLFERNLHENGYGVEFDAEGNVCGLLHEYEKWYEDTSFFDVFATCVAKGSYIEMSGEDGEKWRMIFDGEHCFEENAEISWPEYDEVVNGVRTDEEKAVEFIASNPGLARAIYQKLSWDYHREDVLAEIAQREDDFEFSDADVDAITRNFERILSKNDGYYESYWLTAGEAVGDFVREHTKKPALDKVIRSCEEVSKNGEEHPGKECVEIER